MSNPLLQRHVLPPFKAIKAEMVEPAISQMLEQNLARIAELVKQAEPTWQNLVEPMTELDDALNQAWSPVGHLNSVLNSDELRQAYNACLPKLSAYGTQLGQNQALCQAYQKIADSAEFASLSIAQQKSIQNALRDFTLAGVALSDDKKQRYGEIKKRLSELTSKFSENVLDSTNAFEKIITDVSELAGVPQSALDMFAQMAKAKDQQGYLITLDFPSYMPVLTYCENRALREELYTAYCTRASELSNAGKFDNSALMDEILALRHELAHLLGFSSYAHLSLATKMAENPEQVIAFLRDLSAKAKPQAEQEVAELIAFAKSQDGPAKLESWDVSFYSEKLKQAKYDVDQEAIRPYLPVTKVLPGLFEVAKRLFSIDIQEESNAELYHPDVKLFAIFRNGEKIARFYFDLYARNKKRGGAWMDDCRVRRQLSDGSIQLPVAYLVCNFTPPVGDKPALLTHDELTTLFHEFGHGLHHMLTRVSVAAVSGINGVAWDAVELPSQFMENWCYEPEALAFISGHYESGEPLPKDLLDKLLAAKNFQSAMMTQRQLEFSLFDFLLHYRYDAKAPVPVQEVLNQVRAEVAVFVPPAFNRFQHSFSHIFAGGYAAGYYSYKWAEVLSADAFSRFEEDGIFNAQTGADFLNKILSRGGEADAAELFRDFRGRDPQVDALLRHSGISGQ
ncbi:MAG: oligopeptidase A [Oceanospirillaceae bacterium]|nr:oligopeptidase A [Oceanospirillaceae bacterium]MCP5334631.1 oligopeptidase A [Oceanospirillaceae bacterium]